VLLWGIIDVHAEHTHCGKNSFFQSRFYLESTKNSFNRFQSEKCLDYMYKFSFYFIKDTLYHN